MKDYENMFVELFISVFHNNVCRVKNDYCGLDTCQNGGTCTSIFGGYRCSCLNGYTGKNCQTNINECTGNPCNNGGTCVDEIGRYSCQCTPEYGGKKIEVCVLITFPLPSSFLILKSIAYQS